MLNYPDGTPVHIADHIVYDGTEGVVETIVEGDDVERWDLDEPGILVLCDEFGRLFIPNDPDLWRDVTFVRRGDQQ